MNRNADIRKRIVILREKAAKSLAAWTKSHTKLPWTIAEEEECKSLLSSFEYYSGALEEHDKEYGNG